jgi:hypothetical protein
MWDHRLEGRKLFLEREELFEGHLPRVGSFGRGTGLVGERMRAQAERALEHTPSEAPAAAEAPVVHEPKLPITGSLEKSSSDGGGAARTLNGGPGCRSSASLWRTQPNPGTLGGPG